MHHDYQSYTGMYKVSLLYMYNYPVREMKINNCIVYKFIYVYFDLYSALDSPRCKDGVQTSRYCRPSIITVW